MNPLKYASLALLGSLSFGALAQASETIHYTSAGFEAPTFSQGQLAGSTLFNGQDGWLATGDLSSSPDLSKITVQSQLVHSGSQAARIDATNQPTPYMHMRRNELFAVTGAEPLLDIRMDMYIATAASTPSEWMMQAQSGPGPGSGILEWWIDTSGVLHMTDVGGDVNTGQVVTRDQWHNIVTRVDYNAQTVEVLLDGQSAGVVQALGAVNDWFFAFASVMFSTPGDDQMVFDNFVVATHDGTGGGGQFTSFCAGDGSAAACPCGNPGQAGAGCMNSTGLGGLLVASGSTSVVQDDMTVTANDLPTHTPALLFFGNSQLTSPTFLGDGLLCVGGQIQRVGVKFTGANGSAQWSTGIASQFGFQAGDVRSFQTWYRNTNSGPCGSGFNLSNGVEAVFAP